jgi:hypothetical protein
MDKTITILRRAPAEQVCRIVQGQYLWLRVFYIQHQGKLVTRGTTMKDALNLCRINGWAITDIR